MGTLSGVSLTSISTKGCLPSFPRPNGATEKVIAVLRWGAHTSCHEHRDFLNEEFVEMIHNGQ